MVDAARVALNPHAWITTDVFIMFANQRGVALHCPACRNTAVPFIDTGFSDGMVPRSSAYSMTPDGRVNMGESVHMPVIRVVCLNCGHLRLFATFVLELWQSTYQPQGTLFPYPTVPETNNAP